MTGTVLGIAFDGLGYGTDGTLWGGEFLVADFDHFERAAHLRPVAAARWDGGDPRALADGARLDGARRRPRRRRPDRSGARSALERRARLALMDGQAALAGRTTSAGRLFDAVAALLGLRSRITYEGQAAIELETLARNVPRQDAPRYPADLVEAAGPGGLEVLDPAPLVATVLSEIDRGTDRAEIAAGFHEGLGRATAALAARLARRHGLDTVALSGGVFQNARLSDIVEDGLVAEGLTVLVHELVPPNDGGISIGQAAVAALGTRRPDEEPERAG